MISYSPDVGKLISDLSQIIKRHSHLTKGDVIAGLRILSSMIEADIAGGRIKVEIINIVDDEDEDSSDDWKRN